jgi:ATP-dependent DNA helicase PIF1
MSYREDLQGTIILPQYIPRSDTVEELCDAIYPTAALSAATENLEFFAERSIVTIRNDAVAVFNDRLISRMTGDLRTYWSADRAQDRPGRYQPTLTEQPLEYLNSINMPGLPPSKLALRVGAPIMLIRNLRQEDGLCNGTRLIITGIYHWNITARIIAGDRKGVEHTIPRIPLETTDGQLSFTLRRVQFPIRLCFAMTINKSQGQSLKQVGVDLRVPAFSHGQLYVALSRVTDVAKLSILHAEGSDTTDNVVFPEVLQRFSPIALAVGVS